MSIWIQIKKHAGVKSGHYYTVHIHEGMMQQIRGRFSTRTKAEAQARRLAVRYNAKWDG